MKRTLLYTFPLVIAISIYALTFSVQPRELSVPNMSVIDQYGHLPLRFEINEGQTDLAVKFLSRSAGRTLFLTSTEAVLVAQDVVLRMTLLGADDDVPVTGVGRLPGAANYLIGSDPTRWHTDVATYSQVRYSRIYPGIDLLYYGNPQELEYDFVVAPGADPARIRLALRGASAMAIDDLGDVVLQTAAGEVRLRRPRLYQEVDRKKQAIAGAYVLEGEELRFQVGAYDHGRALVIDPVLAYSTYLGGTLPDVSQAIAVDAAGNAYVTGGTSSANFPGTSPGSRGGAQDAFVAKLNRDGTALVYSTYLGGNGDESGGAIAVDVDGRAYVVGSTSSTNFPVNPSSAFQTTKQGDGDGFVAKLNPMGTALDYSTYLGGSLFDVADAIALDAARNAYVTGFTHSTNFPVTAAAFQNTSHGAPDIFVAKVNPAGTGLLYSTYLGGGLADAATGIAVDPSGSAYVTGVVNSTDFPVTPGAFQVTSRGNDAFVTKLDAAGSALVYSSYLGGTDSDGAGGIAVDAGGNAYVTGGTRSGGQSGSSKFPVTPGAFQTTLAGTEVDAFVAKMNAGGTALVYATFLGGSGGDNGHGIAVDRLGNAYVTGSTASTSFPVVTGAIQPTLGDAIGDAFVTKVNPTGAALVYSTYLGGSLGDLGVGIAVDTAGDAFVTGETYSANFPVSPTATAFQKTLAGGNDGFVTKLSDTPASPPQPIPPFQPRRPDRQVVSPPEFPYVVTFETACVESIAGKCLRAEVVRTCIGGQCFDVPPRGDPGPPCLRCMLALSLALGIAFGAIGGLMFGRRRRRPGGGKP